MCKKSVYLMLVIALVLLAGMVKADITTGLLGYWKLDGDVNDSSGNEYHGEEYGGPSYVPGVIDQAMEFNGIDQSVYIPDFTAIAGQDAVTVSMWVKPDRNTGGDQVMWFTDEDGSYGRVRFGINGDEWEWKHGDGSGNPNADDGENPISLGEWIHLTGIRINNDRIELFVNGVSVDQTSFGPGGVPEPQASIGSERRSPTSVRSPFDGVIDEVRIYNRALSVDDIVELYEFRILFDFQEIPENGSIVSPDLDLLQWILPDPNDVVSGTVTCDVWFSDDYPEYGMFAGDPNFTNYAAKIVGQVSPEAVGSVAMPVVLEKLRTYYWRIDTYDDSIDEPQPVIGPVFTFNTNNQTPGVDVGEDLVTWLTEGSVQFELSGVITDEDGPDPLSVVWDVIDEPNSVDHPAIISPAIDVPDITVTATLTGTYVLALTAFDGVDTGEDTVTITVYSGPCEAAKGEGATPLQTDFNEDCVTDFADLAVFAGEWLESIAL